MAITRAVQSTIGTLVSTLSELEKSLVDLSREDLIYIMPAVASGLWYFCFVLFFWEWRGARSEGGRTLRRLL